MINLRRFAASSAGRKILRRASEEIKCPTKIKTKIKIKTNHPRPRKKRRVPNGRHGENSAFAT